MEHHRIRFYLSREILVLNAVHDYIHMTAECILQIRHEAHALEQPAHPARVDQIIHIAVFRLFSPGAGADSPSRFIPYFRAMGTDFALISSNVWIIRCTAFDCDPSLAHIFRFQNGKAARELQALPGSVADGFPRSTNQKFALHRQK